MKIIRLWVNMEGFSLQYFKHYTFRRYMFFLLTSRALEALGTVNFSSEGSAEAGRADLGIQPVRE